MMNTVAKTLVLFHLGLAILALTWATGLYLQFLDYGWLEPRLQLDKRVASEFDKRVVAHEHARAGVERAVRDVNAYVKKLHQARENFAQNDLLYLAELEALSSAIAKDGKDLKFKAPHFKGGTLALTRPEPYAAPDLSENLKGIVKSYKGYREEFLDTVKKIDVEMKKDRDWIAKHAEISSLLNGKHVGKDIVEPGLYDLIEEEDRAQKQAKYELDYLEKIWAPVLQEAEVFVERRVRLQKTLDDLLASRVKKKAS
ncbi:MAG: hypothetical protein U0793_06870 [Gemmataceae bacterium]